MATPQILNTSARGLKVLFLGPDAKKNQVYEARSELDADLIRVDLYSASNISEARILIRQHSIRFAIFFDDIDGKDFVSIQLELRNANPSIETVPLIGIPSIEQLREARHLGGIFDYGTNGPSVGYDEIKQMIFNYIRERVEKPRGQVEIIDAATSLGRALTVGNPGLEYIKALSSQLLVSLASHYDISADEVLTTIAAEQLFQPHFKTADYEKVLGIDKYGLAGILAQTGTWVGDTRKPTSISGLLISMANFISHQIGQGADEVGIVNAVLRRPPFLLHPGIRTLSKELLHEAIQQSRENLRATG